jgi:glycosyltransferase involved in cell wall biosynthesis
MGLSGVQRTLKFVKYLPEFGWQPTVLTVEPEGYFARDETLLEELKPLEINVVRTSPVGPGRLLSHRQVVKIPSERRRKLLSRLSDTFFIPDNKKGWRKKAVTKAVELHQETPFDLLFATAPPFTDFLIGAETKAQLGKPLVLDYRDPWVDYPFKFYPTPIHKWYTIHLERRALRASNHVITTNRRVKELLIERYPFLTYHDIDIIPQGFDPDDISGASKDGLADHLKNKTGVMRITYSGVFWEDRVPDQFLRGLADLLKDRPELRGRIEAWFVGNFRDENSRLVEQLGLKDTVHIYGYLPHRDAVRYLVASDVLWVIVGDTVGSPGKTYEYIGTGKPILGLVPEGFLRSAILEAGGRVVGPHDVSGIKHALSELYDDFLKGALRGADQSVINKYNRRLLTGDLVKIFESLID